MNQSPITEQLFNSPIESGLRSLFVLASVIPKECDLQRLVIYDYLLVHSDDVTDGPIALHPPTPLRSGELLVRRTLVGKGLQLMFRKGLVTKNFTKDGVYFSASQHARKFLKYLTSEYSKRCADISMWITDRFQPMSDDELRQYIYENLGRWGAEFTRESVLWEELE